MHNRSAVSKAASSLDTAKLDTGKLDTGKLAEVLADCVTPGETLIVGVTGSVAAGKTTLCTALARHLQATLRVEIVSTDGFLLPNDVLESRGLSLRKGFPESYDAALMSAKLQRARWGAVEIPGYSHKLYDRSAELDRIVDRPDILLVEGLGFAPGPDGRSLSALLDVLIYIDAAEDDLETWFVRRFMEFWRDAETNAASFYARFRSMSEADAEVFARAIWAGINLPNLRDHIQLVREDADIVLRKAADHSLHWQAVARTGPN